MSPQHHAPHAGPEARPVRPSTTALSATRRAARATLLVGAVVAAFAACSSEATSPAAPRVVYGSSQALGDGVARTYVVLDAAGKPSSVGVALSEAALTNLPSHIPGPGPAAATLWLTMPTEAPSTGFDHVMLDWNPAGHEPEHVYTHPHFDFHFYQITQPEVMAIMPTDPQWAEKAGSLPGAEFIPTGYASAHVLGGVPAAAAAVPMMGLHWLDTSSPELQPPPANHQFTETFIYGSYDGEFIFIEPMITKAYIESLKGTPGMSRAVPTATKVAKPGYYPAAYSIKYDSASAEYRIALDQLVQRQ